MNRWNGLQLPHLGPGLSGHEAFQALLQCARLLGFDYCSVSFLQGRAAAAAVIVYADDNFPARWRDRCRLQGHRSCDPMVTLGIDSLSPVGWSAQLFSALPGYWDDINKHGLAYGFSQLTIDASGLESVLTLGCPHTPTDPAAYEDRALLLPWLGGAAHQALLDQALPRLPSPPPSVLSNREVGVLALCAEGKTAAQTASALRISQRTVAFHIASAMDKLGAANKTAAVVRAARAGLFGSASVPKQGYL